MIRIAIGAGILAVCAGVIPRSVALDQNPKNVRSRISIFDLESKKTTVLYAEDKLWEAPNWSPDGKYLLANSGGKLFSLALDGDAEVQLEKLALDDAYQCNNDHGISPSGKLLAFSATKGDAKGSQVFVAAASGGSARLITENMPSYFHSWSPDGNWLAFVGQRNGNFNLFRIRATGGPEERLTYASAYDDGPDYSPDGHWIYFNSNRSGSWDIWRMPAEGAGAEDANAERVTRDPMEDWFPHPSPDGNWLVFLSFPKGTLGHDVKTNVEIRMIRLSPEESRSAKPVKNKSIEVLTSFFGGQGTINVNSWSPDSKKFAFVSYEVLPQ